MKTHKYYNKLASLQIYCSRYELPLCPNNSATIAYDMNGMRGHSKDTNVCVCMYYVGMKTIQFNVNWNNLKTSSHNSPISNFMKIYLLPPPKVTKHIQADKRTATEQI
jgi:hypothetical protein